jgi:hypothetical protein
MEIKRSVLEGIRDRLEETKLDLQKIKDDVVFQMKHVSEDIKLLSTMIEQDILDTIKKAQKKHIDPKFCTHANKKVEVLNNAEVVTCVDCNQLLVFKQL